MAGLIGPAVTYVLFLVALLASRNAGFALTLLALGGVFPTPLLHWALLRRTSQPRAWSVVPAGAVLIIAMGAVGGIGWWLDYAIVISVAAGVLAGVVTEGVSRWEVFRETGSSAHGEPAPPTT